MRSRLLPSLAAAAAAATVLALSACGSSADDSSGSGDGSDSDTIVFASIPSEDATSIEQQFEHVIAVIEDETGKTVEIQNATDYAAVIEGMRAGKVQIAGLGPFSYITAKDSGVELEPVGAVVDSADEEPGYQSYAIVPAGSPIQTLADAKGKTVCFVDPTSTSGYLYPSAGLLEAGLDPTTDVTEVMAGGHDASALSVVNGQCEMGFAFDTMVTDVLIESGQIQEGQLSVIWESEVIPGSPVAISTSTLDEETQDQIKEIFAEKLTVEYLVENDYCTSEEECELPEGATYGYVPVDDALYDGVRKVCETTKAEACEVA